MKKTNISKMEKDFSSFSFENSIKLFFLTDILWFLSKIIFISQENGRIVKGSVTVKGSEKNDSN